MFTEAASYDECIDWAAWLLFRFHMCCLLTGLWQLYLPVCSTGSDHLYYEQLKGNF